MRIGSSEQRYCRRNRKLSSTSGALVALWRHCTLMRGQGLGTIGCAAAHRRLSYSGGAEIHNQNDRVKKIRLVATASTHLVRIGEPTGNWGQLPFSVREKLDSGHVLWKHHPRATYE